SVAAPRLLLGRRSVALPRLRDRRSSCGRTTGHCHLALLWPLALVRRAGGSFRRLHRGIPSHRNQFTPPTRTAHAFKRALRGPPPGDGDLVVVESRRRVLSLLHEGYSVRAQSSGDRSRTSTTIQVGAAGGVGQGIHRFARACAAGGVHERDVSTSAPRAPSVARVFASAGRARGSEHTPRLDVANPGVAKNSRTRTSSAQDITVGRLTASDRAVRTG